MKYNTGMYGGSFDPFHIGHLRFILLAASECETLHIIISFNDKRDYIKSNIRYRHIANTIKHLKNVKLHLLEDDAKSKLEYNDEYWLEGSIKIKEIIANKIDVVYVGNDYYGTNRFENLYPEAKIIYGKREISSTQIRSNPYKYWEFIPKAVREYFNRKILIIGSESTGKSILSENLALHYDTEFVHEVGRDVCEVAGCEDFMTREDFVEIMIKHASNQIEKKRTANKLLFVDTDVKTSMFYNDLLLSDEKIKILGEAINNLLYYDLVFFIEPSNGFVQDGTRNEKIREDRIKYSQRLKAYYKDIIILDGNYRDNMEKAISIINERYFDSTLKDE